MKISIDNNINSFISSVLPAVAQERIAEAKAKAEAAKQIAETKRNSEK